MASAGKGVRLSPATRRVVSALADTIIPSEGPERPGALDLGLVDRLMEWLQGMAGTVAPLVAICWLWEFCPLWSGRLARFSRLSQEERTRIFEQWENSRLAAARWALFGLKAVFMAAFYNNPGVWPALGYEEGCLSEPPSQRG
jgi:hypothetical protein